MRKLIDIVTKLNERAPMNFLNGDATGDSLTINNTGGGQLPPRRRGGGGGDEPPRYNGPRRHEVIPADVHSDDHAHSAEFEALPWFQQASDEEIQALIDCDFGGDYGADWVAQWTADHNPDVKAVFDYLETGPRMSFTNDPVGFECYVDEEAAREWLNKNKPHLFW